MIDTAVILAAGMGTRLRDELQDRPKGFLCLGQRPIIEESIETLRNAGIAEIVIVTGHCAEYYAQLQERDSSIRRVHNREFAVSGSMYSLYCARDAVHRDFLLLESDLIYEPRALDTLLAYPDPDAILLSGQTGAGDEVYVAAPGGFLRGMSKNPDTLESTVTGELVGISKISLELYSLMLDIATQAFERSLLYDYETDCLVAAGQQVPIACPVVPDLVWSEIDDPDHLERARATVYPEIRRRVSAARRDPDLT
ncbi:MAG: phosphocholine cytidylyltransferase family protein [Gammaproteobacteria bacterium]|nr:phosphocholine cytidylyltransferase family protein [Gammaproteobacteria bacterium]